MTARIGYLSALAAGRRGGPLLRPARRLFPPLAPADAEYGLPEAVAGPEPGALPSAAAPGPAAPARVTSRPAEPVTAPPISAGPAVAGTAPPGPAAPGPAGPRPAGPGPAGPGPVALKPAGRGRGPAVAAASQRGQPDRVISDNAASPTADDAPGWPGRGTPAGSRLTGPGIPASQAPAGHGTNRSRMNNNQTTNSRTNSVEANRSGTRSARGEQVRAEAAAPPIAARRSPAPGPGTISRSPAARRGELPASNRPAATAEPAGPPGTVVTGTADVLASRARTRRRTAGPRTRPGRAEQVRAEAAPPPAATSSPATGPGEPAPISPAATAEPAGPPGAAVITTAGQDASGPRPAGRTRAVTDSAAGTPSPFGLFVVQSRRDTVVPAAAAEPGAGYPRNQSVAVKHDPPRRRQKAPDATGTPPATLSIGTVEITVLPPRDQKSPVPPSPRRAAPAGPPDRLSRGLGPWFGRDQA